MMQRLANSRSPVALSTPGRPACSKLWKPRDARGWADPAPFHNRLHYYRFDTATTVHSHATDPMRPTAHPRDITRDGPLQKHWTRAHVWAGVMTGALATGPTFAAEIAIIPTALVFLPRLLHTYPLWRNLWKNPLAASILLFSGWLAAGLIWSPDPSQGLHEFGNTRFLLVVLLLVPAVGLRTSGRLAIIGGVVCGFLIGHAVQALNIWAILGDGPGAFTFGRTPERLSGWWDPAVSGTMLTAALGLHLPAALMGRGRVRWIALVLAALTIAGLFATGARGGWIASGALVVTVTAVAGVRAIHHRPARAPTLVGVGVLVLAVVVGGFASRGTITSRLDSFRDDIALAGEGDYRSDDGARFAMKVAAVGVFLDHPVAGVGTGGYASAARADPADRHIHAHAHDTILHIAACNGVIGVALLLAVAGTGLTQASRWAGRSGLGTYGAGPLFALVGLVYTTPFDTLHVSGSSAALAGLVLALCLDPTQGSGRGACPRKGPRAEEPDP